MVTENHRKPLTETETDTDSRRFFTHCECGLQLLAQLLSQEHPGPLPGTLHLHRCFAFGVLRWKDTKKAK